MYPFPCPHTHKYISKFVLFFNIEYMGSLLCSDEKKRFCLEGLRIDGFFTIMSLQNNISKDDYVQKELIG